MECLKRTSNKFSLIKKSKAYSVSARSLKVVNSKFKAITIKIKSETSANRLGIKRRTI